MVYPFEKYIREEFGANTMQRDTADIIQRPDLKQNSRISNSAGNQGSGPSHWNNSPFLSGGRLTSTFGINPKKDSKKKVLSFRDFMAVLAKKESINNKKKKTWQPPKST
mgnify:CR=1 FL=1